MHILIIGVGSIGERHLRSFLRIHGVRCSIAEPNRGTREKIITQYTVQEAYVDFMEANLDDFDGIVICTPTNLHIPVTLELVKAGKHILLEKPLAMNMNGVDQLKRLHSLGKTVLNVGYNFRCDPLYQELRDRILAGEAGSIRLVNYYIGQYWPRMRKDYPPKYAQSRTTGGGAIPDHLVHMINFFEWCFGPPIEVSANQWRLGLKEIATEDTANIIFKFKGGIIAFLGICLCQQDNKMSLQVIGEASTIQLSSEKGCLEIFNPEDRTWINGTSKSLDRDTVFLHQAKHFIDCIEGRDTPRCTLKEAEQTLKTILAALKSSDSDGRFVKVNVD
jgi:predicted dehydrogenase